MFASVLLDLFGVIAIIYAASTNNFSIFYGIVLLLIGTALMPVWVKAAKTRFAELRKAQQALGITDEQLLL